MLLIAGILISALVHTVAEIFSRITAERVRKVEEHSAYYQSVLALNDRTEYHPEITKDGKLYYVMRVNSKAKFDKTEEMMVLYEYLSLHGDEMKDCLRQVSENRRVYSAYISEFESLSTSITPEECEALRIGYGKFREIEQELVDSEKLNMIQEVSITCYVKYTSPKGQRMYSKDCTFLESEIRTAMKHMVTREAYMQSEAFRRKNERRKVTPSLRLQIIERDGRRCCICGRSAREGVTLEVDHIVPISKGGETTYDNLQTLCWDCNRGKGDKTFE